MGPLKLSDKGHPQLKDPPGHAGSNNAWVTADAVHWGLVETRFLTVQEPKGSFNLSVPCRTLHYAFLSHLIHTKRSPYKWFRLPWGCDSLWVCLPMHVPVYFPPNKHYIFSLKKKKSYTILQETIWQYIFGSWNISSLDLLIQLLEISVSVYTSSTYIEFYNFHLFMHLRPSVTSCFRANLYFHRSRHFLHLTWFFP